MVSPLSLSLSLPLSLSHSLERVVIHCCLSLPEYLIQNGRMNEAEARKMFRQIVMAVDYCHKKGIVHRDLKVREGGGS